MRDTAPRGAEVTLGTKVDEYRLERVVGVRPGLDTTVEATNEADGERALLTFPAPDVCSGRKRRRELLRLARLRSSITHPHLAPLLVVSRPGRDPYLVRPGSEEETLAERLKTGRLGLDETLLLLAQVAGALDAAAAHDLPHRDLTPAAIALSGHHPLDVQLTDFGVLLPPSGGCGSFAALQGAPYRPPETVRGEDPTGRSNVYALACIVFECLSGAPPFTYDPSLLTLHAHLVEPPPRISGRSDELPAALDEALARGLAKDPDLRQASAGELGADVAAALGRTSRIAVPATPSPAVEDEHRPRAPVLGRFAFPRRRWVVAGAALALAVSGLSGLGIGSASRSAEPRPQQAKPGPTAAERAASRQRTAYVRSVGRSVEQLDRHRMAGRARLRRARRAGSQAAAASALARTYGATRARLPAPVSPLGEAALGTRLGRAERAYRQLAGAARRQDLEAWREARGRAWRSEREVEEALRRLRSGYARAERRSSQRAVASSSRSASSRASRAAPGGAAASA